MLAGNYYVYDAFNLTDLMPYVFTFDATATKPLLHTFEQGKYIMARLVPLPGVELHVISGAHASVLTSEEDTYDQACKLAEAMPRYHLKHPMLREHALEAQARYHKAFIALGDSAFFLGDINEFNTLYKQKLAEEYEGDPPLFGMGGSSRDIVLFSDIHEGLSINPNLVPLVRVLRGERGATFQAALRALLVLENDLKQNPSLFEAAAREYPETFARLVAEANIPGVGDTVDEFLEHIRAARRWHDPKVGGNPPMFVGNFELYRLRRDAWLKALAARGPLRLGDPGKRQQRRKAARKLKKKRR